MNFEIYSLDIFLSTPLYFNTFPAIKNFFQFYIFLSEIDISVKKVVHLTLVKPAKSSLRLQIKFQFVREVVENFNFFAFSWTPQRMMLFKKFSAPNFINACAGQSQKEKESKNIHQSIRTAILIPGKARLFIPVKNMYFLF